MELTPQQWENVKALFEIALEKTPTDRNSFLAKVAQDSVVRLEVERLLAHHLESGGFLSRPALPSTGSSDKSSSVPFFLAGDLLAERSFGRRHRACGVIFDRGVGANETLTCTFAARESGANPGM